MEELPFSCSFEKPEGFCGFQFAINDNQSYWYRVASPNPHRNYSRLTGPVWGYNDSGKHTVNG